MFRAPRTAPSPAPSARLLLRLALAAAADEAVVSKVRPPLLQPCLLVDCGPGWREGGTAATQRTTACAEQVTAPRLWPASCRLRARVAGARRHWPLFVADRDQTTTSPGRATSPSLQLNTTTPPCHWPLTVADGHLLPGLDVSQRQDDGCGAERRVRVEKVCHPEHSAAPEPLRCRVHCREQVQPSCIQSSQHPPEPSRSSSRFQACTLGSQLQSAGQGRASQRWTQH